MSLNQDRLTFFGVLIAVVVVLLGYLQLGQVYPVAGKDHATAGGQESNVEQEREQESGAGAPEEDAPN